MEEDRLPPHAASVYRGRHTTQKCPEATVHTDASSSPAAAGRRVRRVSISRPSRLLASSVLMPSDAPRSPPSPAVCRLRYPEQLAHRDDGRAVVQLKPRRTVLVDHLLSGVTFLAPDDSPLWLTVSEPLKPDRFKRGKSIQHRSGAGWRFRIDYAPVSINRDQCQTRMRHDQVKTEMTRDVAYGAGFEDQ